MTDFNDTYKFANEVRQTYGTYTKQSFAPMSGKTYKSGRPKHIATFTTDNRVYRHEAMPMVSKAGKPYYKVHKLTLEAQASKADNDKRRREAEREETANQALIAIAGLGDFTDETEEDSEEEPEEDLAKPEPLTYQTRDFKKGHVEHE
jgi:hypothetical protein